MPYSSTKSLPTRVKKKYGAKKQRQFLHVWNATYQKTGSESRAFAAANSVVGKKELGENMARTLDVAAGSKSVKVTLYSGADDPDLPEHVKVLPLGVRSRWVNTYNYGVMDTQDEEDAQEQADTYTTVSVDDLSEILGVGEKEMADTQVSAPVQMQAPAQVLQAPAQDMPRVQAWSFMQRLKAWLNNDANVEGVPAQSQATQGGVSLFQVYKGDDGRHRVLAVYSNMFKDKHGQTICAEAHKEYAEAAEAGTAAYPDLHLWHGGPATRWGAIETVSFVDGFAVAGGVVDVGKEHVALTLKEMADKGELAVSYGFLGLLGSDDVYYLYRPFEISPLPAGSEANPWFTSIDFKENGMAFSDKKKAWFKTNFKMDDATIAQAEARFNAMGTALKAAGVEWKEEGETPPPTPPPTPQPEPPDPTPPPPPDATGILGMVKAIEGLAGMVTSLTAEVKALKEGAPAATAAAADDMVLARIANGPGGFSPTRDPANIQVGMKDADEDFLGKALGAIFQGGTFAGMDAGAGAVVGAAPAAPVAPAAGARGT